MSAETWEPLEGGCLCHSIRFQMLQPPIFANCCHCRNCQVRTGSAFALNAQVEVDALKFTSSTQPASAEVAPGVVLKSCPNCHVKLYVTLPRTGPKIAYLPAGSLDQSEKIVPDAHFYVRSKHPWITLAEGVKTYETMPSQDDPLVLSKESQARMEKVKGKE